MQGLKVFVKELYSDLRRIFGKGTIVVTACLVFLLLGFVAAVVNVVYPYTPLVVHEYNAIPMEVCPGDDVTVNIDYEVRDDLPVLEIVYRWSEKGNPGSLFGGEARFEDYEARPRRTEPSPLVRVAPRTPGVWQIETNYDVYGTRFGMPVHQDTDEVTSENFVRVLEGDDDKCNDRRR